MKKKLSSTLILAWILFSLLTGFSIGAIYTTGGNINKFYNCGNFLPFYSDKFQNYATNVSFQGKLFTTTAEPAQFILDGINTANTWNYLTINLSNMNTNTLNIHLQYFDRTYAIVGEESFSLTEGNSVLPITSDAFSGVILSIQAPVGTTFWFDKFDFSTKLPMDNSKFLTASLIVTLICMLITALIYYILYRSRISINWYIAVNNLQTLYISFGNLLYHKKISFSPSIKTFLRIFILTFMLAVLSFINVYDLFFNSTYHPYTMLLFLFCILTVCVLCIEKPLIFQNWRNPLVASWITLWLISCISDFFVTKHSNYFGFYGYFMLFIMGFLFFVWSNMKKTSDVLWEICKVIEWTFLLCTIFCLLCRPFIDGYRYNGFYNNPNPFGLYLAIVGCAFLCELERYIKNPIKNKFMLMIYSIGMTSTLFLLSKTQCTTATLALGCAAVLWLLDKLLFRSAVQKKRFLIVMLTVIICYIPTASGLEWGLTNLPYQFQTQVIFPTDANYAYVEYEPKRGSSVVYAAELDQTTTSPDVSLRIWDKLTNSNSLNSLLSGRLYHFSTYLQDMNLFGHSKRATVYGSFTNYPHNGFLAYPHTYGIYTLIPYFFMFLFFFIQSVKYLRYTRKTNTFSFFPLAICITFFLENMMDNVDTPFHWVVWFIFTFVMGSLFSFSSHKHETANKNSIHIVS